MNADGFELQKRLEAEPELIEEIDRCAWYSRLERKVHSTRLAILMKQDKMNYETVSISLLSQILDELT